MTDGPLISRLADADDLRRVNRALRAISSCVRCLVHATEEGALIRDVCRVIVEDGGYRFAWFGVPVDDAGQSVRSLAHAGVEAGYLTAVPLTWSETEHGRGATGTAIRTGQPAAVRNLIPDPPLERWRHEAVARGYRSSLALPLGGAGDLLGALSIYSGDADAFDDLEVGLLSELSRHLAVAIQALRDRRQPRDAAQAPAARENVRAVGEGEFRSAMQHSPIGMSLVSPDGRWLEVNPALCRILGYTREEMLGMTFPAITHPDDVDAGQLYRRQMLNREIESYQLEKRYCHKDGRTVWVQLNASLVWDEQQRPRYFVTQIQDITERRRAAADLLAMNQRYARHEAALTALTRSSVSHPEDLPAVIRGVTSVVARTLEVARVGVWRLDEHGTSMRCYDLFEWPASHVSGMELSSDRCPALFRALEGADVVAAHDAHRDPRMRDLAETYLQPHGVTAVLAAPIRARGATVGVLGCEQVGPGRRWTPDEQTFAMAVATLVSAFIGQVERRQLEEQLRQAQKLEAVGQLAGGIAHDFNNILTVILGKSTPIAQDARLPADVRGAAEVVVRSGERAANLTRQLLAFSRRQAMQMRVVDLNAVVADIARMLPRMVGEDVSMRFLCGPRPIHVQADPGMLDQVLLNLAVNARDAMPDGGQLTVEASELELDEAAAARHADARPGAFACLVIRDTGSGIKADHLPHIFEPFFTTKDVGKGTGLGLATTYGIVQQHDGWIEVESEVGLGTVFRIFLPLTIQEPDLLELPDQPEVPSASMPVLGGSETVLVVEDEDAVRELVLEVLLGSGYRVLEASSGHQALEVWRSHGARIDLLLTDVVMPGGMNGFELADQLRSEDSGLRVIFTSGYSADAHHAGQPLRQGVNYLSKPYTLPELAQVVRRSLDAREQD